MGAIGYAEIHHTLGSLPSRLRTSWPEVLADAPHRVDPAQPVPVLFLVRHADRFPLTLTRVDLAITYPDGLRESWSPPVDPHPIQVPLWHQVLRVVPRCGFSGDLQIDVTFHGLCGGRPVRFRNDSYRGTSHAPLTVRVGVEPLPGWPDLHYGEVHCHSEFTDNPVEFGAPIATLPVVAASMGLRFVCVTDHSYDLDRGQPLDVTDPPRWRRLLAAVDAANAAQDAVEGERVWVLPGEELSCGNQAGRNVHLLLIHQRTFLRGKGDGAEVWLHTRPDMDVPTALAHLDADAVALAAHAGVIPSRLERWLLGRGAWTPADHGHERLSGLQILNGAPGPDFWRGKAAWIRALLAGRRLALVAGNDAHGNWNRFRQVGLPFLTMREQGDQVFGGVRTGVFTPRPLRPAGIVDALRAGRCMATTGPALRLTVVSAEGAAAGMGEELVGPASLLHLDARSSPDWGNLRVIRLMIGDLEERREWVYKEWRRLDAPYTFQRACPLFIDRPAYYLRAEVLTRGGPLPGLCLTNPVWVRRPG